jgi:hypothetical protein
MLCLLILILERLRERRGKAEVRLLEGVSQGKRQ